MMSASIKELKGVGEKTCALLKKLDIITVEDLLSFYPRSYDEFEKPVAVRDVREGRILSVMGRIVSDVHVQRLPKTTITTAVLSDGKDNLNVVWFRAPYLRSVLKRGNLYILRGRIALRKGRLSLDMPKIYSVSEYTSLEDSLQPVYPLTAGVTNHLITKLVKQALERREGARPDPLPAGILSRHGFCDRTEALRQIHFPESREALIKARERLVFEEFFFFILSIHLMKQKSRSESLPPSLKSVWKTEEVIDSLPYSLTKAQRNVWEQLQMDLCASGRMARLVQGDVGSGKTILAFLSMILAAENGKQALLMVPTEVLARQHFQSMQELLEKNGLMHYQPVLLTGSTPAAEKRRICSGLKSGAHKIVIGTHALIQKNVEYDNPALVITDEQHRFGVRQREALSAHADSPHILVMSATPIPRTLAMILYGDLDISVIDEMPARRLPIKNCVIGAAEREKACSFIARQVLQGRQAYVICPLVEESEGSFGENVMDCREKLQAELPDLHIEALHGKMRPAEKNRIMQAFSEGKTDILVSTTVVEVGVNVPNAAVMMVENAERFGLAQLHQLRGRVGRGSWQSYCIFINGSGEKEAAERLDVLCRSNDGFRIAEQDLSMRGPGDLLGVRQSGEMLFRIGDIYRDAGTLQAAGEEAAGILLADPELEKTENCTLKQYLESYMHDNLTNLGL